MELTEHVQYIIHSAKTIVYARDYRYVEPEHIMLALFLDENDLPKIILEKLGLDNPRMIRDYNSSIPRKENAAPARYSEPPLSKDTVTLLETAEKEGLAYGDRVVSIEHLFLALFKTKIAKMEYIFGQYHINIRELYFKMKDILLENCKEGNFKSIDGKLTIKKDGQDVDKRYYLSPLVKKYVLSPGTKNFYQKPEVDLDIARTLLSTKGNRHRAGIDNYHYVNGELRMLTEREALRLMGFPDDFKIVDSRAQMYKQAGNSIVVDVLMHILQLVLPNLKY